MQRFKEGGEVFPDFGAAFFELNIGWFYYKHKKFIYEAIKKIENESKPGTYDEITDSKEVYDNVQGPFKNIIKDVKQDVDMIFQVTQRGVPVVGLRIKLNYTHKQGGSNGYSINYVYRMERGGTGENDRWVDPTKSYAEVKKFKKGGTLKVKGRSWYEAGGMVKQAQQMRRFKEEMDNSIRQAKNEIEQSKRSIEKSKQNLVDSADNIKREERSIKENISGMRQDAKEAQEFERRARKYKRGGIFEEDNGDEEGNIDDAIFGMDKWLPEDDDAIREFQDIEDYGTEEDMIEYLNGWGDEDVLYERYGLGSESYPAIAKKIIGRAQMGKSYAKGGRTYSRENRPSPSKSATIFNTGYRSRGNDGNIWEVKENIKGTHRWVKLKG